MPIVIKTCDTCGCTYEVSEDDVFRVFDESYLCDACETAENLDPTDLEDQIDQMAERFPNGEDPMMKHVFFVKCQKCDVDFELYAGQQAWCPSCQPLNEP